MNLTELKEKPVPALLSIAEGMGIESMSRSRKQDIIFAILKAHAKSGEDIYGDGALDRKSTRLNSSHQIISYAVFCLKKKKTNKQTK